MNKTVLAVIVIFLALSGVGGSVFFFTHEPNNQAFVDHPTITAFHVILGAVYLAMAPLQFSSKLRSKHLDFHRWSGRLLVPVGLIIGAAALFFGLIAPYSGLPEQIIIGIFGSFFLFSLIRGYQCVRAKQINEHREWMIRAFAIGLSIATMRLIFIPALIVNGNPSVEDAQRLSIIAFTLAFALHSGFAEYWIRSTRSAGTSNTQNTGGSA